jgi:hypothetical protein
LGSETIRNQWHGADNQTSRKEMTRVLKPFDLQALSIFFCIKVALVTEKTLPTLIQTNETKKSTQIDAFFESKPRIDAFLKIDAKAGIQNGILIPEALEAGCHFYFASMQNLGGFRVPNILSS